jgi:hypothetical protein
MAGSELWCKAVEEGKISDDVYVSKADSEKGLGLYTEQELVKYCINARSNYYARPQFILRLLVKSLKNDDLGFLQSYLQMFFSNIRDGFKFLGLSSKNQ